MSRRTRLPGTVTRKRSPPPESSRRVALRRPPVTREPRLDRCFPLAERGQVGLGEQPPAGSGGRLLEPQHAPGLLPLAGRHEEREARAVGQPRDFPGQRPFERRIRDDPLDREGLLTSDERSGEEDNQRDQPAHGYLQGDAGTTSHDTRALTPTGLHGETAGVPRPQTERWRWLALAGAALAPRVAGAFLRRPWHDEYFTAWAAKLSLTDLVAALRLDSGPPLPYLLVKLLAFSGLDPVGAARAISVAAGTAAVLIAALASRRAFGERAGWWTGAMLAVHPLAVAWSCEGRAYALVLLAAASAWERVEALSRGGHGAAGLAAAVTLACWSHGLGLLLAGVLAASALTLRPPGRGRALGAVGVGLASHLPWLPVALHQPPAAVAWMSAAWRALPLTDRLAAPVRMFSPLAGFATALDLPSSPVVLEAAAGATLLFLAIAGCRRRGAVPLAIGFSCPPPRSAASPPRACPPSTRAEARSSR